MRFSVATAVLALAASSASASIIARQTIPSCADDCLFGSNVNYDGCSETDNLCLCKSQEFISTSTACIEQACTGSDLATALSVSQQLCLAVGVTLTSGAASSTATDAASTSTPTSSASKSASAASAFKSATVTAPASSQTSSSAASTTASTTAPATTSNAAILHSVNAFAGLAAIGLAALAL